MSNLRNKMQTALSSTNNAVLTVAKSMLDEAGIIYSVLSFLIEFQSKPFSKEIQLEKMIRKYVLTTN